MATICNSTLQLISCRPRGQPLHTAEASSSSGRRSTTSGNKVSLSLKSGSETFLHLNNNNTNETICAMRSTPRPNPNPSSTRRRTQRRPRQAGGRGNFSVFAGGMDVPDFLPATWSKEKESKPIGPSFDLTAEGAVNRQLDALEANDHPYPDHGVEVMYRFAGFDPFRRSTYFGPTFDLGQFERFRRIFHHSTYRVLLSHRERRILSSLFLDEHCFKLRVWVGGARPGEEEIFEFTLVQRVGGNWDGYWLTDSLHNDGKGITGGIAY